MGSDYIEDVGDDSQSSVRESTRDNRASSSGKKKSNTRSKVAGSLRSFGDSLNQSSTDELRSQAADDISRITSYKRGGTVKRGKMARLHKGERAIHAGRKHKKRAKSGRM